MVHGARIREGMRAVKPETPWAAKARLSRPTRPIIGGKEKNKHLSKRNTKNIGGAGKEVVFALVERGGKVRSFHVANVSGKTLRPILVGQIDAASPVDDR